MSQYTYYLAEVRTGQIFGDLPFTDVSMEWVLSGSGSFSGKLVLSDPEVVARGALSILEGRTAIYVERDGALIWAGIIWATELTGEDSTTLSVTAGDYWTYYSRRLATTSFTRTGPAFNVIFSFLSGLSNRPLNLGRTILTEEGFHSAIIDYQYNGEERKTVAEMIESLAAASGAFDFRMETAHTGTSTPAVTLVIGEPRLALPVSTTGAAFDFPGNITSYSRSRDGSRLANALYVRGTAESQAAPEQIIEDLTALVTYPRYERAESLDNVAADLLADRAAYLASLRRRVTSVYTFKVRADAFPEFGRYRVGDYCLVRITDAAHPAPSPTTPGFEETMRIGVIKLTPATETVEITPWSDPDGDS